LIKDQWIMKTIIFCILFTIFVFGCSQQNNFPVLKGIYLGQELPGNKVELFAPGIVSTGFNDRDFAIMPDLCEVFYCVLEKPHYVMVSMKQQGEIWSKQEILPFSGYYDDVEPSISPDGKRLYYCSNRPLTGKGEPKDYDIWYVDRSNNGWGMPQNLGAPLNTDKDEFYPSVTNNGTIYFTSADMKIYRSELVDGKYKVPEKLPETINSPVAEYNAFIAPDESYLIFTSHGWEGGRAGRGDLFISFRGIDDSWTEAKNLGPEINSEAIDYCPCVTPDGKYLFFSSMRGSAKYDPEPIQSYSEIAKRSDIPQNGRNDIYWVNTSFIEQLKPGDMK